MTAEDFSTRGLFNYRQNALFQVIYDFPTKVFVAVLKRANRKAQMNFLGKVRQIDIQPERPAFQVILNSPTNEELVAQTNDLSTQMGLQTSMVLTINVTIEYVPGNPNIITRLILSL